MGDTFGAPWSRLLVVMTLLSLVVLAVIPVVLILAGVPVGGPASLLVVGGPLVLVVGCLLFTIRGYEIAGNELLVHRLLWATRLSLDGLRRVDHDPSALHGSLRLWGNGGFFSFSGYFRNKKIGLYRAFVTDYSRVVVLEFEHRPVAVSPDRPEVFVNALRRRRGLTA